jgi:hypothetical protein
VENSRRHSLQILLLLALIIAAAKIAGALAARIPDRFTPSPALAC